MEPFKSWMEYHCLAFCRPMTAVAAIHPDASAVRASCNLCDSGSQDDIVMIASRGKYKSDANGQV
jgi:hypothetical protein